MSKLYALIGYPLEHSLSERFFNDKFQVEKINAKYLNFPLKRISELKKLLKNNPDLYGFNVTMPYKQTIIPYLSSLDVYSQAVRAVNTVKVIKNSNSTLVNETNHSILIGYNTDIYGFEQLWNKNIGETCVKSVLILGNGGATKAVSYVLSKKNIKFFIASRTPNADNQIHYNDIWKKNIDFQVIINATPVGMYPLLNIIPPIDTSQISSSHTVIDLIYNPKQTLLLKIADKQGAKIINGYDMLIFQALKAWDIWTENHCF
ncbi:MAG: shikimate dehydrogenase [Bacteroidales bacterium]|jgi:shikimate dehydrogenase|nr:shikimate dehydrogenase [Bacteroidales bacterium]